MSLDPSVQSLIKDLSNKLPSTNMDGELSPLTLRQIVREMALIEGDPEPIKSLTNLAIPSPAGLLPLRIYTGLNLRKTPPAVILFFHGGGWVTGDLDTRDALCRKMANQVEAVVISIDYHLAPEYKFPACLDDAYAAACWVAESGDQLGVDVTRIAVVGDSAGGNIAAALTLLCRDREGPNLLFQCLIYPVVDVSSTRNNYSSKTEFGSGDYLCKNERLEWYREQYLSVCDDGSNPYISPLLALDFSRLPPAYILTAECDPLRDEAEEYAKKLRSAGVSVTTERAKGMFHGFFDFGSELDSADRYQDLVFSILRDEFHKQIPTMRRM
jgi:acetyl esterase